MNETQPSSTRHRWRTALVVVGLAGALVAVGVWTGPRKDVPLPGPDASPEQVVLAYIEAVNNRDFDTANKIDAREGLSLSRFGSSTQILDAELDRTTTGNGRAHVLFTADFEGGDGTMSDGLWGYILERDESGLWPIVDAGVV